MADYLFWDFFLFFFFYNSYLGGENNRYVINQFDLYFSDMHRQNLLCDVKLIADGVEVAAHKMVLAACSPYFHAMFISFEESKQERIVLKGVDPNALKLLIDYVYSCEIYVTEENVQVYA